MSIEAMKRIKSLLQDTKMIDSHTISAVVAECDAVILTKQPATGEPVAWVVMNGVSKYQVCGAKAAADALCSEMQKRHDLSGSLAAFHVLPLYTHPAPSVPADVVRDAGRYRWLRNSLPAGQGSLTVILDDRCNGCFNKLVFMESLDVAIDAAMLASKEAK